MGRCCTEQHGLAGMVVGLDDLRIIDNYHYDLFLLYQSVQRNTYTAVHMITMNVFPPGGMIISAVISASSIGCCTSLCSSSP